MVELQERPEETFTHESVAYLSLLAHTILTPVREQREHRIFNLLLQMIPGLEERLVDGSDEDVLHVGDLVSPISDSHKVLESESAADPERFFQREV
jgi:hypothetical protein